MHHIPRRVLLVTALVTVVLAGCNRRPPETIHDTAFVRQANALCKADLPKLRAQKRESDIFGTTDTKDREKTATRVEAVADKLDDLAGRLGGLPVERIEDQGEVASWLEEWANYTGIGRQYAEAIRTERASVYTSIAAEGNGPVRRIARFARGNHIDDCVL